jgi:hypothetical protein
MWRHNVAAPLPASGKTVPELVLLSSPYRFVIMPLVEHILKIEHDHPDRQIAVWCPSWWLNTGGRLRSTTNGLNYSSCSCWYAGISASWLSIFPGTYSGNCGIPLFSLQLDTPSLVIPRINFEHSGYER